MWDHVGIHRSSLCACPRVVCVDLRPQAPEDVARYVEHIAHYLRNDTQLTLIACNTASAGRESEGRPRSWR